MADKPKTLTKSPPFNVGQPPAPNRGPLATLEAGTFTGPIPPPAMLEAYDKVCPGAADRIITMAEGQSKHRQSLEKAVVDGNVQNARSGQNYGFVLGLVGLVGGIYLLATGKSAEGYISVLSTLVTLAGVFVYGRKKQERERRDKLQPQPQQRQ